jgi:RNA polymerase sigma-70 factor (ECF subfamily)
MMLALWHAVPAFRGEASPSTFIYRVVHNTALTWYRRRRRRVPTEALDETAHAAPVSVKVERSEALYRAIRQLPELDRSLVLLYLDEVSYRDISALLGITSSNVGVRLNRIRKRLAGLIEESDHDD